MPLFIVGIRSDGVRCIYHTEAETKEKALDKVEEKAIIRRDPYGRNWVQEVRDDVHFITQYPIPDPFVG